MGFIADSSSSVSYSISDAPVKKKKRLNLMKSSSSRNNAKKPRMRSLEFCIISAQDLKNTTAFGRTRCYAVASIYPGCKVSTRIDRDGGTNPTWDAKLSLEIDERVLEDDDFQTQLTINILSRGCIRDKLVGTVRILVCDAVREKTSLHSVVNRFPVSSYLVFRPGGHPQGILNVCIPPGGRFPERIDSISFKRDDDGGRIPKVVCSSFRRDVDDDEEEDAAPVFATSISSASTASSSALESESMTTSSGTTTTTTSTACSSELAAGEHLKRD